MEIKCWEERCSDFAQFINLNNRLPFSSGCPKEEISLNRWYKVQLGKIKNGNLVLEKYNLLNQITNQLVRNDKIEKKSSN